MRKGSESCCRGSHGLVAAAAGGVDNVYSGRERDEAFFQPSGFLVVPVVEGGRVRDRLEVLTLRGDKIAARGDQGVNVADCVEGACPVTVPTLFPSASIPHSSPHERRLLVAVISLALFSASKAACESAVSAVGVAVGVLVHPVAVAASASAATRVAMRRARVFILLFPCGFLSLTGRIRKRLQDAQCPL